MTIRLGVLTIGESPRSDALTADMQAALGAGYKLIERGALDTLVKPLDPGRLRKAVGECRRLVASAS